MALGGDQIAKMFVKLGADITEFEKKMDKASKKMKDSGDVYMNSGRQLTKAITLPLTILAAVSLKAAIDFESAFAGVKKTVNATAEEFAVFRKEIIGMSKDLPASAIEISAVAEAAGQLGIKNEALLTFTKTMIDLGETTDMSANLAATSLARFVNIMGSSQKMFSNIGSAIVELGNNLATTESEIVTMTLRLAGAAKQVHLTEGEVLGLAAALSSVGIRADAGGTAFSKVFIEISKSVALGSKTLVEFAKVAGMSVDDFSKAFKEDAMSAVLAFVEGLGKIDEAGGNTFVVLDKLGIQERRMIDALLRTANAGDLVRRSIEMSTRAIQENSALTEEAGKRYETTAAQLEMTKNQAIAAAIALGDTMKGALLSLVAPLKGLFGWLEQTAIKFNDLDVAVRLTVGAFLAIVVAIGPVLFSVGLMQKAIPILALGWDGLTAAMVRARVVMTAISAHPIIIALTIIAAEIAYLSGLFDTVEEASTTFADSMGRLAKKAIEAADAMIGWTKAQLEAHEASLLLEIAEKKRVLKMAEQIAAARAARGEADNHSEVIRQLSTEITELNFEYIATVEALKELAEAEEAGKKKKEEVIVTVDKMKKVYDDLAKGIKEVWARTLVMGKEFNASKEETGLLEESLIKLLLLGLKPASEEFKILAARIAHARNEAELFAMTPMVPKGGGPIGLGPPDKLEDPPWLVKLKEDKAEAQLVLDALNRTLSQGMGDAASAIAEGIGQMAAGTAGIGDVFRTVLMVLGDVAIRIGRIAIATGIGMEAIKKAFANPATAIAAGVALIALGSWVKSSISSTMGGGGGGGGGAAPSEKTSLGNYSPSFPNERIGRVRDRNLSGDGQRFGKADQARNNRDLAERIATAIAEKGGISVDINPRAIPSGDIEYSTREGTRRANRQGTEVF